MKNKIAARNLLFLWTIMTATAAMLAQESAFLQGTPAIRYEEAAGAFHYVAPCKFPVGDALPTNALTKLSNGSPALCWPAVMARVQTTDGNLADVPRAGVLVISTSLVRFASKDSTAAQLIPDTPPAQISFSYDPKHYAGIIRTKDGLFGFAFQAICSGCTTGAPTIDPNKAAQLESEYREFQESLTQFEAVSKRINDLAAQMRFGVTPKNQPTAEDVPEAMALYSDLNHRLEPLCPEVARPCVQNYEKYQACKSTNRQADCGPAPACSAYCSLTADALHGLKAGMCLSGKLDSAALVPDWSGAAAKMDAARAARGPIDPKTVHIVPAPAGPPLDFMGKPTQPDNPCSVETSYANAMMSHMTVTGIARTKDQSEGTPGTPGTVLSGAPGKIPVSAGVIAGNILEKTAPAYPAVAKAARIQGTVVLQAVISKEGLIENLSVISGPALLQQAALDAVKTWKYRPYLINGAAVEVATQINVVFSLGLPAPAVAPSDAASQSQ